MSFLPSHSLYLVKLSVVRCVSLILFLWCPKIEANLLIYGDAGDFVSAIYLSLMRINFFGPFFSFGMLRLVRCFVGVFVFMCQR